MFALYLFQLFKLMQPLDPPDTVVRYPKHLKIGVRGQAEHILRAVVAHVELSQVGQRREPFKLGKPSNVSPSGLSRDVSATVCAMGHEGAPKLDGVHALWCILQE